VANGTEVMARQITEIYDAIIAEKQNMSELLLLQPNIDDSQTLLSDLTSSSKVAVWRLIVWLIAVAIWVHEKVFDQHKSDVEAIAERTPTGTLLWYWSQCFKYQLGDQLVWQNNRYEYATINTSAQIVKRASVYEIGNQVRIKVAKEDGSGSPIPLTPAELTSFGDYVTKIKFAGTNIAINSSPADEIAIKYTVKLDPLVFDSTGELLNSPGTFPVEDVINQYLSSLPFDGILNFTKLTDEIQKITGVIDPVFDSAQARYGTLPFVAISNNQYRANAGYLIISPSFPLSSTLTYIF